MRPYCPTSSNTTPRKKPHQSLNIHQSTFVNLTHFQDNDSKLAHLSTFMNSVRPVLKNKRQEYEEVREAED